MSGPLAIAAVTLAMKNLLDTGLAALDLSSMGSVSVSALPPDRVTTGETEPNRLNLFLYRVASNSGWRNEQLPSRAAAGDRVSNPPLALDLHYLLTAYGAQNFHAEALLGIAMQVLHETPMVTRARFRALLDPSAPSPPFDPIPVVDIADQIESIKIAPVYLASEDLAKLWSAMQARYRMTMAYMVSVVLIQATDSIRAAQPVLQRGRDDRGPTAVAAPFPTVTAVRPEASDLLPAVRLGDEVRVTGTHFDVNGSLKVVFTSGDVVRELTPSSVPSPGRLNVRLPKVADVPAAQHEWTIGMYSVAVRVPRPNLPTLSSNAVPVALSPHITVDPLNVSAGDVLTVTCSPRLLPPQATQAVLVFGDASVPAGAVDTPADTTKPTTLTFTVPQVAAGDYVVRLRVSGIDSLPVVVKGTPPIVTFDPQQTVTVS